MKFMLSCLVLSTAVASGAVAAPQQVYRCETNGKVAYSDAPCLGGMPIDVTPTKGMDKSSGQSRKGREVQREELTTILDDATRPLHGRSHEDMNTARRRVNLPAGDQAQCGLLNDRINMKDSAARTRGTARGQADVDLYKARKRFFDLKC